jgi:D-alanyl-D-alanine carboxypeptidase
MSPGQSRSRRESSRRRRRRRRAGALATLATLATLAAIGLALALSSANTRHADASSGARRARPAVIPAPALSPSGLPLGKPPLTLSGLKTPGADPLHLAFKAPPRAGLLFSLSTGQVLWERNPLLHLRIASLTKMMTALLAVGSPPDTPVLVTKQAVEADGSKVGVLPLGRHVRLESMLYGLLLPSGNDAAIAIAERLAGSVDRFVAQMNAEAAKLGMGCTRYSSPSGYYDLGNFSCPADLAELAHVVLEQPRLASIVRTYSAVLPFPIKGGKLYLYNNNPMLIYGYPGATGLKTGYTLAAGRCLVATAERDGVRLGVVLLHSPDPGTQARQLLDSGFEDVYHQRPVPEPPFPAGA